MDSNKINFLLKQYGEVQLYLDSGAEFEIHKDADVTDSEIVFVDENGEMWHLDPEKVEYISVHRSHRSGPA